MNYSHIYNRLVETRVALARPFVRGGGLEKHHIIPRCLGGTNAKSNIVVFTPEEHFLAHRLLARMYTGDDKRKMCYAAWTMARTKKIKVTSRMYAILKEQATDNLKALQTGVKRGPMSDEHKQKLKEAAIRRYQDPEQRRIASLQSSGRKHTDETKAKMSKSKEGYKPTYHSGMKGKQHSPETKTKMKAAWEKRKAP